MAIPNPSAPDLEEYDYLVDARKAAFRLENMDIAPATVEGGNDDVFSANKFTLVKPRWVEDTLALSCFHCQEKFTQFKRKHHCRFCGQVFCAKCCKDKVPMPQLGYSGAERVCEVCRSLAIAFKNTYAKDMGQKYEAIRCLVAFLSQPDGVRRFIEAGGIQVLVHKLKVKNANLWMAVCSGLLQLSRHVPVQVHIVEAGVIKAFRSWLLSGEHCPSEVERDCITIMEILCQSHATRQLALSEGILENTLSLCSSGYGINTFTALCTLCLLVEEPSTHDFIVNSNAVVVSRIFCYAMSDDEQVREVSLRILAFLSKGAEHVKLKLVQENQMAGDVFLHALDTNPHNIQITCNAACIVANLSASFYVQASLSEHLPLFCRLMHQCDESNLELVGHVARGMANFAANSVHGPLLMSNISMIMSKFVKSQHTDLRYQGLKLAMRLISHSWHTSSAFCKEDVIELLTALSEKSEVMSAVDIALSQTVPGQVNPKPPA